MLMATLFLLALASLIDGIVYMVRRPEGEGEDAPF